MNRDATSRERPDDERPWEGEADELERASENVLEGWPRRRRAGAEAAAADEPGRHRRRRRRRRAGLDRATRPSRSTTDRRRPSRQVSPTTSPSSVEQAVVHGADRVHEAHPPRRAREHAPGELAIPPGYPVLEGEARGARRAVGIVVSRFNGEVTRTLLESALEELEPRGVDAGSITVMPVPGAFELPHRRDGAREDATVRLHRRARLRDPRRHAALRLRRERGGVRAPARRDRDRRAGVVRRADARPRRPGRAALRQGRRGGAHRARDGRPLRATSARPRRAR